MEVHDGIASAVQHLLQLSASEEATLSLSLAHWGIKGFNPPNVWLAEKREKLSGRKGKKIKHTRPKKNTKEKQQNPDKPVFRRRNVNESGRVAARRNI